MSKRPKQGIQPPPGKHARQGVSPEIARIPRLASDPSQVNRMTPVWKIGHLDADGRWGHAKIDAATLWRQIFPKMKQYEAMTWNEIARDRHRNHSVAVVELVREARDRLEELHIDDVEELFRFRLTGTQRVWGIRDRDAFYILWWDPNHEICPSHKTHT